ncbi:MAG: hypothetical protein HEP71_06490 [Roseivirga sp.]|nr:hypothetical protein [Roseivirga sp.]
MDDQLRKTLASKFENFEAPVGEDQWNSIKDGIVNKPSRKAVVWRRLSIGLILLLIVGVSTWFLAGEINAGRDAQAVREVEKTTPQTDNSSDIKPQKSPVTSTPEEEAAKSEQAVSQPDITHVTQGKEKSKDLLVPKVETKPWSQFNLMVELRDQTPLELSLIEIPLYEFMRDSTTPGPIPMPVAMADSTAQTNKKVSFRPFLGLNLNYLNLRPNPADNLYFKDIGSSLDLSLQQWGLSIGYEMTVRLSDGLKLRNELNLSFKQHKVSFKYIPDASDSENTEFLSVQNTFSPLTLGISAGLLYDLGGQGSQKRELDLGFYYEPVIDNDLGNQELLQYPGDLINMNVGFTFHPEKINWGIRVFSYYSLNRKYSEKALTMTPYGFGVQFLRDKARK